MIHVRRTGEQASPVFEVVVREGKGETRHHVTMSREMSERLTAGKHTPERHVEAAFRFLLDRGPKESILRPARKARERDKRATETRLRGWAWKTRTQKRRRKLSL